MTSTGKKISLAPPVQQVAVDAALLPKVAPQAVSAKGKRRAAATATAPSIARPAAAVEGKAMVNIVAPVTPQVAAIRQKLKQQSAQSKVARVGAAIEAGTVSQADAKTLVLTIAMKRFGSKETAEKWYRSQHLEAFGGRTPAQMVRAGELKALVDIIRADVAQMKA